MNILLEPFGMNESLTLWATDATLDDLHNRAHCTPPGYEFIISSRSDTVIATDMIQLYWNDELFQFYKLINLASHFNISNLNM